MPGLTKLLRALLFYVIAVCSSTAQAAAADNGHERNAERSIPWFDGSVEEAFAAAKAQKKPIFLYWGAVWCPPCHELKATVFKQDEFIAQSSLFIPVYLDGDTERAQKYGEKFNVYGYPTVIVFTPEGEELTRIPGGMDIGQYVSVLELALNAIRPVKDLLAAVEAGQSISDDDWKLLANYSWGQDRGEALGERDEQAVHMLLADACPDRLVLEKSMMQMMAIDNWARNDERYEPLTLSYRRQIDAILRSDTLATANIYSFAYTGGAHIEALAEAGSTELQDQIVGRLEQTIADPSVGALKRLDMVYGWASAKSASFQDDEELSEQQQNWVIDQVESVDAMLSRFEQHTAINTMWQLYYDIGREDLAREMLKRGIATSDQPYYFMSGMGYVEKEAGNAELALGWYRQAWESAEGPATRVQWGSGYLMNVLELSPDDTATVAAVGAAIFAELAGQADPLHHRNTSRMDRLGKSLIEWRAEQSDDSDEAGILAARDEVTVALRRAMDQLCADSSGAGDAVETCNSFLIAEVEEEQDS